MIYLKKEVIRITLVGVPKISIALLGVLVLSLCMPSVLSTTTYGNYAALNSYIYNPFGQHTAWNEIKITFAYNDATKQFIADGVNTHIDMEPGCLWLYHSYMTNTISSTGTTYCYGQCSFDMGSFLMGVIGYHRIELSTTVNPNQVMIYYHSHADNVGDVTGTLFQAIALGITIYAAI